MNFSTTLQLGLYRDGENDLDVLQAPLIDQAFAASARDPRLAVTVEDFTARRDFALPAHLVRSETYAIRDGQVDGNVRAAPARNPSSRAELARFVARTLDDAEANQARTTWIDLVDHGGGDGGGLESPYGRMRTDDMARAIGDGVALHARAHPGDAGRRVDGVLADQCLMATLGFADALSHAGVRYLAASPETILAPGVPTTAAEAIVRHPDDPDGMARELVGSAMRARYRVDGEIFAPAAAFDVIDCDPAKIGPLERAVKRLDGALAHAASARPAVARAIRADARSVPGMARFTRRSLPWRADRPALALYDTFARDARLPDGVRSAAAGARDAVAATVLAHAESRAYAPYGGADYGDATGPTVHFPTTAKQRDPWAPNLSETDTAFYARVGAERVDTALGTA
ncbi:MAG: Clostripain family [Candidatus Eremiobacteraeota bacterium]|jgi:hypothetical protein|nr:Clostripain family [Candidatus Eremiobacteraeota bacterium]